MRESLPPLDLSHYGLIACTLAQGLDSTLADWACPCPWPWLTNNLQLHTRAHFGLRGDLALVGAGIAGLHIFNLQGPVFVGLLKRQETLVSNEDRSEMEEFQLFNLIYHRI